MKKNRKRVLAIDPTNKGFGFVVFEGPKLLVDWGVTRTKTNRNHAALKRLAKLVTRYRPDVLVVEEPRGKGSRRCKRVEKFIEAAVLAAEVKGLKVRRFSRAQIRRAFRRTDGPTKEDIAATVAEDFPELAPRLPRPRKPWMSEAEAMNIFDAASLALTYFGDKRGRPRRG